MLNEAALIEHFRSSFAQLSDKNLALGIGDDAAVLPINNNESYVISKDILVQDKHFRMGYCDAPSIAHKALHVNISDIAAMGATACFALLGLALPNSLNQEWVGQFSDNFIAQCQNNNITLIGGDTTSSNSDLFISVTIIGRAHKRHLKFRHGGKAGDVICIAGTIGESYAGLIALERGIQGCNEVKQKQLLPRALSREGAWLGTQGQVTAMMDVSDGLYLDMCRLAKQSGCGAVLDITSLLPSLHLSQACATIKLDPLQCMLAGGEDYALLFSVSADGYDALANDFHNHFGYSPTRIGLFDNSQKVQLIDKDGQIVPFRYQPFSHFGEL